MMCKLTLPESVGGKATDAIFDENGNISEMWISLDTNSRSVEFPHAFNVIVGARIHVGTKTETVSK